VRILITGASGLLGAELSRASSEAGHETFSSYSSHRPLFGEPVCIDLIILDSIIEQVRSVKPEVIVHAAAITDVDLCEREKKLAYEVNGLATGKIAQAAEQLGAYMAYVSTDYVFDGTQGSYDEDAPTGPVNYYGESKLVGENLVKSFANVSCIARTSVIYGFGREHRPNFLTWLVTKLRAKERVRVVTDQIASPTFNKNLAEMLLEVVERRYSGVIHLAGATHIDRYSFALKAAAALQLDHTMIEPIQTSELNWIAKRPRDSSLDVRQAKKLLKKKPLLLDQALELVKQGVMP
jgi:dTDP-4-dehydrorhamnose reductase